MPDINRFSPDREVDAKETADILGVSEKRALHHMLRIEMGRKYPQDVLPIRIKLSLIAQSLGVEIPIPPVEKE